MSHSAEQFSRSFNEVCVIVIVQIIYAQVINTASVHENSARHDDVVEKIQSRYKRMLSYLGMDRNPGETPPTTSELFSILSNFCYTFSELSDQILTVREREWVLVRVRSTMGADGCFILG